MQIFSLLEFNQYVRQALALNFPEEYWLEAELSNVKESRGNIYCELIETDPLRGIVVAQSSAVIWKDSLKQILLQLSNDFYKVFRDGQKVRIRITLDFHERYGIKYQIKDIQPEFTLGIQERTKQETLAFLIQSDLVGKNKKTTLPVIIKNIAIISSPTAAGYADFINQISSNNFNYSFNLTLFPSAMQGGLVPADVSRQLDVINTKKENFDLVIIIRGGGSKQDMNEFDDRDLAIAIANTQIPVITGIGHETDTSVADHVAFRNLKTPTAVGAWIIEYNVSFESCLNKQLNEISQLLSRNIVQKRSLLDNYEYQIQSHFYKFTNQRKLYISQKLNELNKVIRDRLQKKSNELSEILLNVTTQDPGHVLDQGFALVAQGSSRTTSIEQIDLNKELQVYLKDGKIISTPTKTIKHEK